jgi:hypothetical protein
MNPKFVVDLARFNPDPSHCQRGDNRACRLRATGRRNRLLTLL